MDDFKTYEFYDSVEETLVIWVSHDINKISIYRSSIKVMN